MIRIIANLFAVIVALTAFFQVAPLYAGNVSYISSTGNDSNPCTAALPCATFNGVFIVPPASGGQINCLNSPDPTEPGLVFAQSLTIDCAGVYETSLANFGAFKLNGANQVVHIRNFTISGTAGGYPAIKVTGSGTLILENCVFEYFNASGAGPTLDIEPNGVFNLVVTNSRVSNNAAGVLLKPAAGGSVTATFDGVTITNNGGGLKVDATFGPVEVGISNSTISNNVANGVSVISGPSAAVLLNLSHDVIASNGSVGLEANGAVAVALVDSTLLDNNASGATLTVAGGRVITYGNNRIVGSAGSGFSSSTPLQ